MFACEVAVHITGGVLERARSTYGASDSANVTAWICRLPSVTSTVGHL